MASKKNNLQSSGSPAPKSAPLPKVSVADTVHTPDGSSIGRVIYYDDFLESNRANHKVEGFWFDQDTFENIVARWADFEDIPIILKTTPEQLDVFCQVLYGQSFYDAFWRMRTISKMKAREVIDKLSCAGNATAVAIAKTHFAKLIDDDGNKPINITIKNDLD